MKISSVELSLEEKISEFESWITPSIQQISETETYRNELRKISRILDSLGAATNGFESIDDCNPQQMAIYCIAEIESIMAGFESVGAALTVVTDLLDSLISMLFLVTGKSDNNIKCQFPVYLLQSEGRNTFPISSRRNGGRVEFNYSEIGRVIKQEKISKLIAEALVLKRFYSGNIDLEGEAIWLLEGYIKTILDSHVSTEQLWALGFSYFNLKENNPGLEGKLLSPIVTFKVKGSVAAQSGHIPEKILRKYMSSWGLKADVDFNLDDVVISGNGLQRGDLIEAAADLHEGSNSTALNDLNADPTKTRAYDFVLPYQTPGWPQSIFIQSQFYAGDSGSVSHKVVDQTRSSRILTRAKYPNAVFVEYLDGAGYYASLNRDLQHMLEMPSTDDFIQVRTAHIKLRRSLQKIGFLTPLDFVHALFRSGFSLDHATTILEAEGYDLNEINRCFQYCITEGLMNNLLGKVRVAPRLLVNSRRIMIIDMIIIEGEVGLSGGDIFVLIPGARNGHGVSLSMLGRIYERSLISIDSGAARFSRDLEWLTNNGFIKIKSL